MTQRFLTYRRVPWIAALLVVAGLATAPLSGAASPDDTAPEGLDAQALATVSAREGVPETELEIVGSTRVDLPLQGLVVYDYKVFHEAGGALYRATLDPDGAEHDLEALTAAEGQLHYDQYGALDPDLFDRVQVAAPGEVFPVVLWVRSPFEDPEVLRLDPGAEPTDADLESVVTANDQARRDAAAQAVAPVVDQLVTRGFTAEADDLAPVVYTELPVEVLRDEVARWPEVLAIGDDTRTFDPTLEIQLPACQTNVVHNQGITGQNVNVAAVEVGGQINTANPFLAGVFQDTVFSCPSFHAAAVAGIIRSTNTARLGHAYNSNLWVGGSCFGNPWQLLNRSSAAAFFFNSRAFNLSFGAQTGGFLTLLDRYYDWLTLYGWRTVVPSAGNSGAAGFVGSPGTAYNVVTVGSYDDRNTTFWPDDVMSGFSSTLNPFSLVGDRTKPEVAAPGSNINSCTNTSPWTGPVGSGTSYSAPAVTGISALLMQRNRALQIWPESVKAILMASAEHNIEGAARLSNRDGAGGVVADRADRVARRVPTAGNWSGIFYGCGNPFLQNLTTVNLQAGQRVRFAMAWDTNPFWWLYPWWPGADLDLWVLGPAGYTAFSLSWDNTYEIVDFVAPVSGPYTFQTFKFRCSTHPYWLGWAWHIVP